MSGNVKSNRAMHRALIVILLILVCVSKSLSQNVPDIEKLDNSVVIVLCYDYNYKFIGYGSGFVVDSSGIIVTNYHVVKNAFHVKVKMENKPLYDMEMIVSGDSVVDLVKIRIRKHHNGDKFIPLKIATSLPKKGEPVWCISTPKDTSYMNTVSQGLVANLRVSSGNDRTEIQTNTPVAHGSSGGPLINSKGQVVGVITWGEFSTLDGFRADINFAVWIREMDSLQTLNLVTFVDANSIPGELSFYTDYQYNGDVLLFINNVCIGKLDNYITKRDVACGDPGTITRSLQSGFYKYYVYYSASNKVIWDSVYIEPGQCRIVRVPAPGQGANRPVSHSTRTKNESPRSSKPKQPKQKKQRDTIVVNKYLFNDYKMLVGVNTLRAAHLSFFLNDGTFSVQLYYGYVWRRPDSRINDARMYGVDYRIYIINRVRYYNFYHGPSLRTKIYYYHSERKRSCLFLNYRIGFEYFFFERLSLSGDIGFGYPLTIGGISDHPRNYLDADLTLGLRLIRR